MISTFQKYQQGQAVLSDYIIPIATIVVAAGILYLARIVAVVNVEPALSDEISHSGFTSAIIGIIIFFVSKKIIKWLRNTP